MLQNRVDPFGNIIKTPARGAWLGNRGVIHNDDKEIVRSFKLKAWITCALHYKDRHREIMAPNRWTELFFLDEATAFSAGHRPCFQCRYRDHQKFKEFWVKSNPQYGFDIKTPVAKIDDILQKERITSDKSKITFKENSDKLPDGAFVLYDDIPYLVKGTRMYLWGPAGYETEIDIPKSTNLTVLTPLSIVNTFNAGYIPQMGI
jgi:hypothetical protein